MPASSAARDLVSVSDPTATCRAHSPNTILGVLRLLNRTPPDSPQRAAGHITPQQWQGESKYTTHFRQFTLEQMSGRKQLKQRQQASGGSADAADTLASPLPPPAASPPSLDKAESERKVASPVRMTDDVSMLHDELTQRRKTSRVSVISERRNIAQLHLNPSGGSAATGGTWPLLSTPSPGALPRSSTGSAHEQLSSQGPDTESLITCVEKFLLCEHKNTPNILLHVIQQHTQPRQRAAPFALGTSLLFFLSKSLNQRVPLVPPTSSLNRVFKLLVAAGLTAQLVFELKNVTSTLWIRSKSGGRPGGGGNSARSIASPISASDSLYRLHSFSTLSLSPTPLSLQPQQLTPVAALTSSALTAAAGLPEDAKSRGKLPHEHSGESTLSSLDDAPTVRRHRVISNLTALDRKIECVGASLLMLAINWQILKAFFPAKPVNPILAAATAGWADRARPSMSWLSKLYMCVNSVGLLVSLNTLFVAAYAQYAPKPVRNNMSHEVVAQSAEAPRSLPLILPSMTFVELTHALLNATERDPAGDTPQPMLSTIRVLKVMAILSCYYWSTHYKYTEANGSGSGVDTGTTSMLRARSLRHAFTGHFACNARMLVCLFMFTKILA